MNALKALAGIDDDLLVIDDEVIAPIDTDAVHLDLFGPMKPGILRAAEGENFLYLIMPVRV